MLADMDVKKERLHRIKVLLQYMEADNQEEVDRLLDELSRWRESQIFQELGKLTRELHDTLNNFQVDVQISQMTERDIPDAKERLNYVITMTEQAANRTLNAVEESLPLAEEISIRSGKLYQDWDRFRQRKMPLEEFKALSGDVGEFLNWTTQKADRLRGNLSEVLMAQDFQDLTGQIIRRVITLVQEVENKLVELIRVSGGRMRVASASASALEDAIRAEGPHVPGTSKPGVMSGQDDVDGLLSSLGF